MSEISRQKTAPGPMFDDLAHMANPRRNPVQPREIENFLGRSEPEAAEDFQIAAEFIYAYRGNRQTFMQYRRATELLLAWAWLVNLKPLAKTTRQDIERFMEFSINPPEAWVGKTRQLRFKVSRGIRTPNPKWRPFYSSGGAYNPKPATVSACFKTLGSFFGFLVEENYISQNPVLGLRQKSKFIKSEQEAPPPRFLSAAQWHFVHEAAKELASDNPAEHERTLFAITAMFCMYLRISELVGSGRWRPVMGHFHKDSRGRWWFRTVGKGNKERNIAVSNDMLDALRRYRRSRGLIALPYPGEQSVLLHARSRTGGLTSVTRLRMLCKQVFLLAAQRMSGMGRIREAKILETATPHWLRHTGISFDVSRRPLHHIRDDAGHSSIRTTNRYIDSALEERHSSAKRKPLRSDPE